MPQIHIDPVISNALGWLETHIEKQGYKQEGDCAILIYEMVMRFPMTIAQYWDAAKAGQALTGKNSHTTWMLSQAWCKLSDWSLTGKTMIEIMHRAEASGFCVRADLTSEKPMNTLRERVAHLTPHVSWDTESFATWIAHPNTPLVCWTKEAVMALPVEFHVHILQAYLRPEASDNQLKPIETHAHLRMDVLQFLLHEKHWPPSILNDHIVAHMEGYQSYAPPQTAVMLDAWFDTLAWTRATATVDLNTLTIILGSHEADNKDWLRLLPRIATKVAEILASDPGSDRGLAFLEEIEEATDSVTACAIYAATPARLPTSVTAAALECDGLLTLLGNTHYSIEQRLKWVVEYSGGIIAEGHLAERLTSMESPIRESVALWVILQAVRGDKKHSDWYKSGVTGEQAASKRFLNKYAPNLATTLAAANTLDLSFPVALEMFLSNHPYRGDQPTVTLPSFQ